MAPVTARLTPFDDETGERYLDRMPQEPLTNAAVEWVRAGHAQLNALDGPPSGYVQTDDFIAEDRRTGTGGLNFGTLDRAGFAEFYNLSWELGARAPRFSITDVVAVRGGELAAVVERIDDGDGMIVEHIAVIQLDTTLRRHRRSVIFDVDAADAAIAELDRLCRAVGD